MKRSIVGGSVVSATVGLTQGKQLTKFYNRMTRLFAFRGCHLFWKAIIPCNETKLNFYNKHFKLVPNN